MGVKVSTDPTHLVLNKMWENGRVNKDIVATGGLRGMWWHACGRLWLIAEGCRVGADVDEAISERILDGQDVVCAGVQIDSKHTRRIAAGLILHAYGLHQAVRLDCCFAGAGPPCVSVCDVEPKGAVRGKHELDSYASSLGLRPREGLSLGYVL